MTNASTSVFRDRQSITQRKSLLRLATIFVVVLALVGAACTPTDDAADGGTDTVTADPTAAPASDPEPTEAPDPEPAAATEAETEPEPETEAAAEPEPTEEQAPALTASWRGVTEDTITVGVSMLDFGALAELGLVEAGWGDQQAVWEAYIADLNARGGINGRLVEAVYSYYSPLGTEAAETTCLELTKDVETFAVLGGFLGPAQTVNNCVTTVNNTIMINGTLTRERLAEATAPWVQAAALGDRQLDTMLNLLDQEGMLQGRNVAVVGSVELGDVAELVPAALEARGVTPVTVLTNDVPQGEIQASNDAWQVYAERIAADGADTVFVIGSGQAALRGIDNAGLDVETWVLNVQDLSNLGAETPKEMARGAITVTGMTDQERWEHDVSQECLTVVQAAIPDLDAKAPNDLETGEEAWFNPIVSYCSWLQIFELLATAAGPELTHESFFAAIDSAGDFETAGIPFGSFGPGKPDANDSARLGVFDPDASDAGDVVGLTDILDTTP